MLSPRPTQPLSLGESSKCTETPLKEHQGWVRKHQEACSLVDGEPEPVNPITFNCLDTDAIILTALHTYGANGPSGLDAYA